jgi:PAT family beta-lactamase induction signal transducer AmpG
MSSASASPPPSLPRSVDGNAAPVASRRRWRDALAVYREPAVLRMLFFGFSAGLPFLLVFGTLSFWLREAGVDRTTIGFASGVALAYAFKWTWAPLVDRLPLPLLTRALGRRRSWLLIAQLGIAGCLAGMALTDPQQQLGLLIVLALGTAISSATQDIALDAYRIESAPAEQQAALAAAYQTGYRVAMIWAGAGALWLAARFDPSEASYEHGPWTIAYLAMAASMLVGVATTLLAPEPRAAPAAAPSNEAALAQWLAQHPTVPPLLARLTVWLNSAVISPFADFFLRYRWHAALILALIATYRISDVVMGVMAFPFYKDMGFTKDEVAAVSKVYGVLMTLAGAFIGGVLAVRFGVLRVLFAGALLSAATNLLFAWMATLGPAAHDVLLLTLVVSADNLSSGIASSAFIAYLSGLTHVAYSATQYALFSSTMQLLPKFTGTFSGLAVDSFGYPAFFAGTALLGVPVLALVALVARWAKPERPGEPVAARADTY